MAGEPVADRAEVELPAAETAALVEAARRAGVTLSTAVQGAWALVLGMVTGRDDVVFGTTVSGRSPEVPGVESMVGLLINTVPARATWSAGEPVAAVLDRLQRWQAGLLDHHHVGLPAIQRAAGGELFDTLVVVENTPLDAAAVDRAAGEVEVRSVALDDATHYPASLIVTPGERLGLRVDRTTALAGGVDADRLATWLVRALAAVAADADRPAGDLDLLDADERARAVGGGASAAVAVEPLTLAERIAAQAAATPHAVAAVCEGERLTYAELDARAAAVAAWLAGRGAGPEAIVAVELPRSLDLIVALVGVLQAGAAYLPLDPDLPAARRVAMVADAGAVAVVDAGCPALRPEPGRDRHGPRWTESPPWPADPSTRLPGRRPRQRRLRHLHLGVDRRAQGGGRDPPGHRQPPGLDAGTPSASARATACCRRRPSASTCRCGSCSGRCARAPPWCWPPPTGTATPATWPT